jgi:hypothetical protein
MNAQQAPSAERHTSAEPLQMLSTKNQRTSGGMRFQRKYTRITVTRELGILLNRFDLSHPSTPT